MRHICSFTSEMIPGGIDRDQSVHRALDQAAVVGLLFPKLLFEFLLFGDVAGGREHTLKFSGLIVKRRGVIADDRFLADSSSAP